MTLRHYDPPKPTRWPAHGEADCPAVAGDLFCTGDLDHDPPHAAESAAGVVAEWLDGDPGTGVDETTTAQVAALARDLESAFNPETPRQARARRRRNRKGRK